MGDIGKEIEELKFTQKNDAGYTYSRDTYNNN